VNLINLDGLTIIGPGSEWFWSAASGIVLAVTFIAIYRQLRVQAATAAMAQIDAVTSGGSSERYLRHALRLVRAVQADPDNRAFLPEGPAAFIENYHERIGTLARRGSFDMDLLLGLDSSSFQIWWWLLEPHIRMSRERAADPRVLEDFEWLVRAAVDYDRRTGHQPTTEAFIRGSLDRWVGWFEEQIQVELELRSGSPAIPVDGPQLVPEPPTELSSAS
jgi:hypothetical protein